MPPGDMGRPRPAPAAAAPDSGQITGKIELLASLQNLVRPGSVVFLMAHEAGSASKAPLAVAKIPVATFPIPFVIGMKDLMGGQWGRPVKLSARLDQDGDAGSKNPGDLYGESPDNPVSPGTRSARVVLDQVL